MSNQLIDSINTETDVKTTGVNASQVSSSLMMNKGLSVIHFDGFFVNDFKRVEDFLNERK